VDAARGERRLRWACEGSRLLLGGPGGGRRLHNGRSRRRGSRGLPFGPLDRFILAGLRQRHGHVARGPPSGCGRPPNGRRPSGARRPRVPWRRFRWQREVPGRAGSEAHRGRRLHEERGGRLLAYRVLARGGDRLYPLRQHRRRGYRGDQRGVAQPQRRVGSDRGVSTAGRG